MKERAELLKEEVREIIKGTNELPKILDLVVKLQRLGLDSHYETEIDEHLRFVYNSSYDVKDLNLVSQRFYLLRKNGYDVSSGKALLLARKTLKRNNRNRNKTTSKCIRSYAKKLLTY